MIRRRFFILVMIAFSAAPFFAEKAAAQTSHCPNQLANNV